MQLEMVGRVLQKKVIVDYFKRRSIKVSKNQLFHRLPDSENFFAVPLAHLEPVGRIAFLQHKKGVPQFINLNPGEGKFSYGPDASPAMVRWANLKLKEVC